MRRRRLPALLVLAAATLAALPDVALAHGIVGREDLPIPKIVFQYAACGVLVASFVGLAVLWPKPRLEAPSERRLFSLPTILDPICGAIGVAVFALVVYAGFAGTPTAASNLAPTFIFVLFWVGLAFLSPLVGDVFAAFNPWRAIARAVAGIASLASRGGLPAPLPYPERLGRWPAAVGVLAFTWVELVYSGRGDPSNLAVLALVYAAVQFVGMALYGIEPWNRRGDAFAVYYGLFARISPLRWERGAVFARTPFSGLTSLDPVPGTVALLCVMIGTTSFDGFQNGPVWGDLAPSLTDAIAGIGLSEATALEVAFTIGLVGAVLVVAGCYRLGVKGMRREVGEGITAAELGRRFTHSLVPIALAYVVAHYFSLLAYDGQRIAYLASDPLGNGADYFGLAGKTVDYGWVSATAIWYVQVAALVIGHVAALVLAHDRALATFSDGRVATRSQYWMLAVMIGFTSLGLWLLSAANS